MYVCMYVCIYTVTKELNLIEKTCMEFEEPDGEIGLGPSYDNSLGNSGTIRSSAPPRSKPKYKECMKNHAVGIGGHAVDGCGEFIPAGKDGTAESLKCAACSCHRNFHRKQHGGVPFGFHLAYRGPSGYLHVATPQQQRPPLLALPSTSGGGGGSELEEYYGNCAGKKRFRTKFTADQKEKMANLAGQLGWRIQKEDEEIVQKFCEEVKINRQVLKVWMHNNKSTLGKKP